MNTLFKTITASQLSPANEQPEKKAFFPEEKKAPTSFLSVTWNWTCS